MLEYNSGITKTVDNAIVGGLEVSLASSLKIANLGLTTLNLGLSTYFLHLPLDIDAGFVLNTADDFFCESLNLF